MGRDYKAVIKKYRETEEIVPRAKRIMKLDDSTHDKYRSCNICRKKSGQRMDLMLGCCNQSVSVCICRSCLSDLGDKIWEYLGG